MHICRINPTGETMKLAFGQNYLNSLVDGWIRLGIYEKIVIIHTKTTDN